MNNQGGFLDKIDLSWKGELGLLENPYRLVSLLDILRFYAGTFVVLMSTLQLEEGIIYDMYHTSARSTTPLLSHNSKYPKEAKDHLGKTLIYITEECKKLDLSGSLKLIKYIARRLPDITLVTLQENIRTLREMIESELGERLLIAIPQKRVGCFEQQDAFGLEVSKAFSKAIPDIKEAGNCYAVGLYTACVFHLMRILEHGLRALAKDVGLTFYRQSWGKIIDKIRDKVDDEIKSLNKQQKDHLRTERLTFLSHAAKEFGYFKDGWRNYAMHGLEEYDAPKAESVLNHVKAFMIHLSTKLTE